MQLQFPEPSFRMKVENGKRFVFDTIRKTWLLLTDEEWVRQNFINYLLTIKKYPSAIIAVEKEIYLNELKKRFDILIYDKEHKPWMMIECKGSNIQLDENVLQQILRYNISTPVTYIAITNGHNTLLWEKADGRLFLKDEFPHWE